MDFEEFKENEQNILSSYSNQVLDFISQYGWYLLGLGLLLAYLKPYVEDATDRMQRSREQKQFEAKCKKDPNFIESQRQAIEKARMKMQEEHDKRAALHAAKIKEKEEKRVQELLSQECQGNRLGNGSETETKKKSWKPDYNPLMGSSSPSYRPPKRSKCSGGGCG